MSAPQYDLTFRSDFFHLLDIDMWSILSKKCPVEITFFHHHENIDEAGTQMPGYLGQNFLLQDLQDLQDFFI
jgi:hypothetical protein